MLFNVFKFDVLNHHLLSSLHNFEPKANPVMAGQLCQDPADHYILASLPDSAQSSSLYQDFTRSNSQPSVMLIYNSTPSAPAHLPSLSHFSFLLTILIIGLLLSCCSFGLICSLAHRPRLITVAMLSLVGLQVGCIGLLGDRLLRLHQQLPFPTQLTDSRLTPPPKLN